MHCALIFVALALLVLGRLEHPLVRVFSQSLAEFAAKPLSVARSLSGRLELVWERANLAVHGEREVERLRRQIVRLRAAAQDAEQVRRQLESLEKLVKLVRRDEDGATVTARVLAGSGGVFRRSLLIDGGVAEGVYDGFPVFGDGGLIGRTIDATDDTSRVLLLSDINSRVPVNVGARMYRAILAGDGSSSPRLHFLQRTARLRAGEAVETSGAGGIFPAGLAIGEIVEDGGGLRVRLHASDRPQHFVRVHTFRGPGARLTGILSARSYLRRARALDALAHSRRPVTLRADRDPVLRVMRHGGKAVVR